MSRKSDKIRKVNDFKIIPDLKFRLILEGAFVGLITGVIVSLFRFILQQIEKYRMDLISASLSKFSVAILAIFILAFFLAISMITKIKEPLSSGSGIPQVKGELTENIKSNWLRVLVTKFVGSIASIAAGFSLGREGPSVQLGAMVGKGVSRLSGRLINEEKYLLMCGAGSGLAAAFGAPIAGVIFVLEELKRKFSHKALLCTMAGAITSDWIASKVFGLKPVFKFNLEGDFPLKYFYLIILLGLILGVCSSLYIKMTDLSNRLFKDLKKNNLIFLISVVPIILLSVFYPMALGPGDYLVELISKPNEFTILSLFILLILKFLFSIYSSSTGASGGTLLPILVIGGIIGGLYGNIVCSIFSIDTMYIPYFIVFGMVGHFSGVVRSPITGIILISEATGMEITMLTFAIPALISYVIAELLNTKPLYDFLLEKIIKDNPKYKRM